jgi:hypothetical protein
MNTVNGVFYFKHPALKSYKGVVAHAPNVVVGIMKTGGDSKFTMAAVFHRRCGERITLTNGNRTAIRNFSEFNYGLVLSGEPLAENQLFEVRIDKKVRGTSFL